MNEITERDLRRGADILQEKYPIIAERIRRHIGNTKAWEKERN